MATLEQSNTYNEVRENEDWSELSAAQARALLQDAEDYIRGRFPIRSGLSENDQRIFDGLVCRLAAIFQKHPPQGAAQATIKKESKEGAGFKKEVEYNPTGADPYPYITAVIGPFLCTPSNTGGFAIARLVR